MHFVEVLFRGNTPLDLLWFEYKTFRKICSNLIFQSLLYVLFQTQDTKCSFSFLSAQYGLKQTSRKAGLSK